MKRMLFRIKGRSQIGNKGLERRGGRKRILKMSISRKRMLGHQLGKLPQPKKGKEIRNPDLKGAGKKKPAVPLRSHLVSPMKKNIWTKIAPREEAVPLAPLMLLPFSAPCRKLKPSLFQRAAPQPVAGPSKKRYAPATGPQYKKPNTRRRGLDGGDEGSPAKKRKTEMEGVVKTGPPKGIPRDKLKAGKKGKDRAN